MNSRRFINNVRPVIWLFIITIFTGKLLYCQTDSLQNITVNAKEKYIGINQERVTYRIGTFISANNEGITLGSKQAGLGVIIDLEDALDLDASSLVLRGTGSFRFGERRQHTIVYDYFRIHRKATKILEADLEFGDYIYPVGTRIDSKFNLSIIRAKYEYSFLQDDRVSMGFSLGMYILPINFSVSSKLTEEQTTKMTAPLPVLGFRTDFLITKKLALKESAELLYLKFNNFTGSILDLNLAFEYKIVKHFGLGIGLNSNKLFLSAEGKDYPQIDFFGSIKMDYTGGFLYGILYF